MFLPRRRSVITVVADPSGTVVSALKDTPRGLQAQARECCLRRRWSWCFVLRAVTSAAVRCHYDCYLIMYIVYSTIFAAELMHRASLLRQRITFFSVTEQGRFFLRILALKIGGASGLGLGRSGS